MLANRQCRHRPDMQWLRCAFAEAIAICIHERGPGPAILSELEEISAAIVSDRAIAGLHRTFMQIPGPTDVITFQHGEIVVSADTAAGCALEFGHTLETELLLYLIHGLLHLQGFDDHTDADRGVMTRLQETILPRCAGGVAGS
jgi:probable rRNA maturation factor